MKWGFGAELVRRGGRVARAAQVLLDCVDDGDEADPDEREEAAQILEAQIKGWWELAESFEDRVRRDADKAVAEQVVKQFRLALYETYAPQEKPRWMRHHQAAAARRESER